MKCTLHSNKNPFVGKFSNEKHEKLCELFCKITEFFILSIFTDNTSTGTNQCLMHS